MNLKYVVSGVAVVITIIAIVGLFSTDNPSSTTESEPIMQQSSEEITAAPLPIIEQNEPSPQSVEEEIVENIPTDPQIESIEIISPVENPEYIPALEDEIMVTKGEKHLIDLNKIKAGGPPKDGIPPVDNPQFTDASNENHVSDSDVVIGLEINGDARAYPLSILVWHEIVNDNVGGVPVSVTYCPLCYTNQVFERVIDGQEVEFGTSGKLYNSNLVMYDRLTDSYWSQALGKAIAGELTGYQLDIIPFDVISWGDWKELYPDTVVLTTNTGHVRAYGVDPYGSYYTEPTIIFPVDHKDPRMHEKEIILGFREGGVYKAYKQQDVESAVTINDQINNKSILLISLYSGASRAFESTLDGEVLEFFYKDGKILDTNTNSEWNYDGVAISGELEGSELNRIGFNPGFWFEWVAFHPWTLVYGDNS